MTHCHASAILPGDRVASLGGKRKAKALLKGGFRGFRVLGF